MTLTQLAYYFVMAPGGIWRRYFLNPVLKRMMGHCGEDVQLGKGLILGGAENIHIGNHVSIGPNCVLYAGIAPLTIGNHVMLSPHVTIITGEHRTDVVGEYMRNITGDMKLSENDKPVVIEDDVWIGSNVTIMKGVTIGRGSIIHAGAVVSRKVKPYTIYVSDKVKVSRFSDEQIQEHERLLKEKYHVEYPEYHPKNDRLFG